MNNNTLLKKLLEGSAILSPDSEKSRVGVIKPDNSMSLEQAFSLASNENTHPSVLSHLAKHPKMQIQHAVAYNPNTPAKDLLDMAGTPEHVNHVIHNPVFSELLKSGSFDEYPEAFKKAYKNIINKGNNVEFINQLKKYAFSHPNFKNLFIGEGSLNELEYKLSIMDESLFDKLGQRFFGRTSSKPNKNSPTAPTQHNIPKPISKPKPKPTVVPSLPFSAPKKDTSHAANIVDQMQKITGTPTLPKKFSEPKKALTAVNPENKNLSPVYNAGSVLNQTRKK